MSETYSNTTEQGKDDDKRRVQQHRNESARRQSRDHLSQSNSKDLSHQDHEEVVARSRGVHVETRDVDEHVRGWFLWVSILFLFFKYYNRSI